jgi:hypothetical protein
MNLRDAGIALTATFSTLAVGLVLLGADRHRVVEAEPTESAIFEVGEVELSVETIADGDKEGKVVLLARNEGRSPGLVDARAQVAVARIPDPMGRMASIPTEVLSRDLLLTLEPGEETTVELADAPPADEGITTVRIDNDAASLVVPVSGIQR